MFKLTFELLLCGLVVCLAALYVRDRCCELKARLANWLRVQRMVAAATVMGPQATRNPKPKIAAPKAQPIRGEAAVELPAQPVATPVASMVDGLDLEQLEIPTCFRRRGTRAAAWTLAKPQAAKPAPRTPDADEELVAYPQ